MGISDRHVRRRLVLSGLVARRFLLGAVAMLARSAGAAARRPSRQSLRAVALGMGPVLASELAPGMSLPCRPCHGRVGVYWRDQFIGCLPDPSGDAVDQVRLAGIAFDAAGRLHIEILV